MNEVLPSLGGVALFAAAGLGLAELLPALRAIPLLHRLGYAYLFGLVAVSGSLWALSHFAGAPLRPPAVWATAAAPALAGLVAWGIRRWWAPHPRPLSHPHSQPPGEGSPHPGISGAVPLPPLPVAWECGWERGVRGVRGP